MSIFLTKYTTNPFHSSRQFSKMKEDAVNNFIENGLYENAKKNAETMLTAFFGSVYDLEEYQIKFVYK